MTFTRKKEFLAFFVAAVLIFSPSISYAQQSSSTAGSASTALVERNAPPVAQTLVPEGAFAMELAKVLGLGEAQDEAQAEKVLSAAGIEPSNGWISEYPVTPDMVVEIKKEVVDAAREERIDLNETEARQAVSDLLSGLKLNITEEDRASAANNRRPAELKPPVDVVDRYYELYGPPVVTYYAPPAPYIGRYVRVPRNFWWNGFFFSGFFVLNDFDRRIRFRNHRFVVTNRLVNPFTHRVFVVDPVKRHFRSSVFAGRFTASTFGSPLIRQARPFTARRFDGSAFTRSRRGGFVTPYNNKRLIIGGTGGSVIARDFNTMTFGSPLINPTNRRWAFGAESLRAGSAFRGGGVGRFHGKSSFGGAARGGFRGHGRR